MTRLIVFDFIEKRRKNMSKNINSFIEKKIYIFFIAAFLSVFTNIHALSKETISPLSKNPVLLKRLKDFGFHKKICDKYLDRYSVVSGIEYYDFNGNLVSNGTIVVLDVVAENVVKIFRELKVIKFPIAPIDPTYGRKIVNRLPFGLFGLKKAIDDDNLNNVTNAYCCRQIQYTDKLSLHSFGTAIDINTLQNPCIFIDEKKKTIKSVVPKEGIMYLNRKIVRPNKPYGAGKVDDTVVKIFQKYGFDIWGGDWNYPIDYQHFQVSGRNFVDLLILMKKNNAQKLFNKHTACFNSCGRSLSDLANDSNIDLAKEYIEDTSLNKTEFFKKIDNICLMCKKIKK